MNENSIVTSYKSKKQSNCIGHIYMHNIVFLIAIVVNILFVSENRSRPIELNLYLYNQDKIKIRFEQNAINHIYNRLKYQILKYRVNKFG